MIIHEWIFEEAFKGSLMKILARDELYVFSFKLRHLARFYEHMHDERSQAFQSRLSTRSFSQALCKAKFLACSEITIYLFLLSYSFV